MSDEEGAPDDDSDDGLESASHGRVAFARIEALTLGAVADPWATLRAALVPGTRVERHRRVWLMGQVGTVRNSLVGRIGFQAGGPTELWDEEAFDFREAFLPAGTTSLFALTPGNMRIAFQLRPGLIKVKTFTGALQSLMNAASPTERWRVTQEVAEIPFDAWLRDVERVSQLRVKLRRPNPHYAGRQNVKALVDGANSRMTDIIWNADPDDLDGIDLNEPFVREAIEHTVKYGRYRAKGLRAGVPSEWDSEVGASETVELDADPETREVDAGDLRAVLGDATTAVEPEGPEDV